MVTQRHPGQAVPCDSCGTEAAEVVLSTEDRRHGLAGIFRVLRCVQCGFLRTDPQPLCMSDWYPTHEYFNYGARKDLSSRLFELVAERTATKAAPLARRTLLRVVKAADLGGPVTPGSRLLDVGAGSGHAIAAFRRAGVAAYGLEPSAAAVEAAHQRGETTVLEGTLDNLDLGDGTWDIVRFWHALEHVRSPAGALLRAHALLRPGGRLLVGVPNFASLGRRLFQEHWDGLEVPRHLYHFTPVTLRRALVGAGFRIRQLHTMAIPGVTVGSLDSRTRASGHQRTAARQPLVGLLLSPVELLSALAGYGDGIWAVAYRP